MYTSLKDFLFIQNCRRRNLDFNGTSGISLRQLKDILVQKDFIYILFIFWPSLHEVSSLILNIVFITHFPIFYTLFYEFYFFYFFQRFFPPPVMNIHLSLRTAPSINVAKNECNVERSIAQQ